MPDATGESLSPDDQDPFGIDTSVAHLARIGNYLAGGDANFAVDREAAEQMAAALSGGLEAVRAGYLTLEAFTRRTVRYLASEAGIDQFLQIGVSIPTDKMVHQIAFEVAANTRYVYCSTDHTMLAHAHWLRKGAPKGAVAHVHESFEDPQEILRRAAETLRFDRPVALLIPTALPLIRDDRDPHGIVAQLRDAMASGSYLAIAHPSFDIPAEGMREVTERLTDTIKEAYVVRTRPDIERFFEGFDLVSPGLVPIGEWRPDLGASGPRLAQPVAIYGGVARKSAGAQ